MNVFIKKTQERSMKLTLKLNECGERNAKIHEKTYLNPITTIVRIKICCVISETQSYYFLTTRYIYIIIKRKHFIWYRQNSKIGSHFFM